MSAKETKVAASRVYETLDKALSTGNLALLDNADRDRPGLAAATLRCQTAGVDGGRLALYQE